MLLLPIPVSVVACYLGIVLLGTYSRARLTLLSLFFVFIGMLLGSLLLGLDASGGGAKKTHSAFSVYSSDVCIGVGSTIWWL